LLIGFLLTAIYIPGISGAATTPKWAVLAIGLPLLLLRDGKPSKFTIVHLFGALSLAWSALSLFWTSNRLDGLGELAKLIFLAQAFVYGSRLETLSPIIKGLALGLLPSSIVVLLQIPYPLIVAHATSASGLFINSGSLAEITALVLVGLLFGEWSKGWVFLAPLISPCFILPESRGALLAVISAATVWLWSRSRRHALGLILLACIAGVVSFYFGFRVQTGIQTVMDRLAMWSEVLPALTWAGHGIGSFWTDYAPLSTTYDIFVERPEHLHNDWLELIFEGGIINAVCCAGLLVAYCAGPMSAGRTIFAAFAAEALVGFPLHNPCTAFVAALCLGHLARQRAALRDLFDAGRTGLYARWDGPGRFEDDRGRAGQRRLVSA
jgi:O-antigen ligase